MKEYNFLIAYINSDEEPYRTAFTPLDDVGNGSRYVSLFSTNRCLRWIQKYLRGMRDSFFVPAFINKMMFNRDVSRIAGYLRSIHQPGKNLCIITNQHLLRFDREGKKIEKLRDLFPGLKVVYFFTDLVDLDCNRQKIASNRKKYNADLILSYDSKEAERYNFLHCPLPYSLMEGIKKDSREEFDIFFMGRSKNRYGRILEAYDYFTGKGLSCGFYVITEGARLPETRKGIKYYRHGISYRKYLELASKGKSILEIIQEGSSGYTSRVPEAVFLGKNLISNNRYLIDDKLCKSGKVFVYDDITQVDVDLLRHGDDKQYDRCCMEIFNPQRFLSFVETELNKL